ncbi:hypothetical protein GGTG_13097 [Gaeumannomyces tritici R3-111a-1]|uniref:Uncharacterized protein n=1 Tax=Gaeumannomyces tritici (strain R3-111a-1) TaxID=644352 RepID=J3PHW6_GAET3|nr:hypothetical protein GGTG_13097 [Gaeumannomyces tritici R3-111a-1]EJT69478.1 hypothetical protein GGTG_13097 [Gaeumannomyces tritici R3-111a-1]
MRKKRRRKRSSRDSPQVRSAWSLDCPFRNIYPMLMVQPIPTNPSPITSRSGWLPCVLQEGARTNLGPGWGAAFAPIAKQACGGAADWAAGALASAQRPGLAHHVLPSMRPPHPLIPIRACFLCSWERGKEHPPWKARSGRPDRSHGWSPKAIEKKQAELARRQQGNGPI